MTGRGRQPYICLLGRGDTPQVLRTFSPYVERLREVVGVVNCPDLAAARAARFGRGVPARIRELPRVRGLAIRHLRAFDAVVLPPQRPLLLRQRPDARDEIHRSTEHWRVAAAGKVH